MRNEFYLFSQIGESFDGVVLTREEYERVEAAYVDVAVTFLTEVGAVLTVSGLEYCDPGPPPVRNGDLLTPVQVGEVIRPLLREEYWCRLESLSAYVFIGWDFYMYLGAERESPSLRDHAHRRGLFVEDWPSPYRDLPEPRPPAWASD